MSDQGHGKIRSVDLHLAECASSARRAPVGPKPRRSIAHSNFIFGINIQPHVFGSCAQFSRQEESTMPIGACD